MRWSEEDYQSFKDRRKNNVIAKPKQNKYKNTKVEIDGIKFDSQKEGNRYCELMLLQNAGKIFNLKLQVKYELQQAFKSNQGEHIRAINYIGDFEYTEAGKVVVEDTKGFRTAAYLLKKKMFMYKHQSIEFREV